MRSTKVIHVNEVSNVAVTLCAGLEQLGYSCEVFPLASGKGIQRLTLLRMRIKEFMILRRKMREADVVHIHYGFYGIYGILTGVPYFLHLHGSDVRLNLNSTVLGPLTRLVVKSARGVFFSTPDLGDEVWSLRPDAIFVPNPIVTDRFGSIKGSPKIDKIRILSISRLNDNKGIALVFRALKIIKDKYPEIEIHAMGSGLDGRRYRDKDYIDKYLEEVSYAQMPEVLASYDILVGQMAIGAIGMTELEGMATGRPVIANFQFAHVYNEPPPLLSVSNVEQLIEKISWLIGDTNKRNELGHLGREWVVENHDYLVVAKYLRIHYT